MLICFKIGSYYVAQALNSWSQSFLPQPPQCWDFRYSLLPYLMNFDQLNSFLMSIITRGKFYLIKMPFTPLQAPNSLFRYFDIDTYSSSLVVLNLFFMCTDILPV